MIDEEHDKAINIIAIIASLIIFGLFILTASMCVGFIGVWN